MEQNFRLLRNEILMWKDGKGKELQKRVSRELQRAAERVDKCSVMAINKIIRQKLSCRKKTAFDRKHL